MKKKIIYEICVSILAIIAVALAIQDIYKGLSEWQLILDNVILVVFIAEYFVRLFISKDKKAFFKDNILDLIAIIPFSPALKFFRVAKLTKLLKLAKIVKFVRLGAVTSRFVKKSRNFLNTNGFKYMLLLVCIMILAGALAISYLEHMPFSDGLWWAFVTTTTVGYGDLSPATPLGRCIAIILMLFGIGLIGSLTSTITTFFMNTKPKTYRASVIDDIHNKLNNISELSEQDIDDICAVLKALRNK